MKPVSPSNGPYSKALKLLVSFIYALTPLAIMVYRFYQGERVDSIILLIVLAFILASGYVIFGEKIMDKATEEAQDISTEDDNKNMGE